MSMFSDNEKFHKAIKLLDSDLLEPNNIPEVFKCVV